MNKSIRFIARAGVISALYAVLSIILTPLSSGQLQLRVSECLCLLPLVMPQAIVGVTVGCIIANIATGCALFDIIIGSLITLISALLTGAVGKLCRKSVIKIILGGIFPVLLNAFVLPLVWSLYLGQIGGEYIVMALWLTLSQIIAVYALGAPIYLIFNKIQNKKSY